MEQLQRIDVLEMVDNINNDISEVLKKIASGNAILFTGAGFSSEATNIKGEEPPCAKQLADLIAEKGNFSGESDLKFSSNYFLRTKGHSPLIELLKDQYTLNEVDQAHKDICSIKWKRIYTTNYDNSIELALRSNGQRGECITLDDDPQVYYKKENICVHINGNISSLRQDTIPDSFKLSTASYLSPDSFINSKWFYSFKKDLEKASAIVFVGYSLYDIDIQKILFGSPHFKEKTFFITYPEESKKSLFELSEFGKVYRIGVSGFAKEIIDNMPKKVDTEAFWLESFSEYIISHETTDIRDQNIYDFLLHGKLESHFFDDAITNVQQLPYLIIRDKLDDALRLLQEKNFLTVISDFGNGKTVFLRELASALAMNGKQVFLMYDYDSNYIDDIDKIRSLNTEIYLIIDNYENCFDAVKYLVTINDNNIKVILSTRTNNQGHLYDEFESLDNMLEISVDILSDLEISKLSNIIENAALWGEQAGFPDLKKQSIIKDDNRAQLSHTLLNLLNAPQMKGRIDNLLAPLLEVPEYQDTILGICILEIMNHPLKFSSISEISLSNTIYKTELSKNQNFIQLFPSRQDMVLGNSSLFARNLLSFHFKGIYTVNKLLKIVTKYHKLRHNSHIEADIYKSLLRFSFIERVLPHDSKRNMLIRYYEQLKSRIVGLERTPHFWLQYAMARIAMNDFHNAQNCLETAYAKAHDEYDTSYLDAQQSRLWIKLALEETDQNRSIELIQKAHRLLKNLDDNQYKYRQVEAYFDYFEAKYMTLSKKNKAKFISFVNEMARRLDGLHKGYFTESNRMDYCHQKMNDMLDKVNM